MDYSVITTELSKRYGQQMSVDHLSLSVPHGAVYGFLGPNGAGKTTTLKMLLGLVHPTGGSIELLGRSVNQRNRLDILRSVGSLIESPSYYGHLTATENLEIVRALRQLPKNEIDRVLRLVRLNGETSKTVSHFSLGMKQRLGIAAAMMGTPQQLLLDEPTNGLDPAGIQEMRELVKSLPAQYDMTVMVSSHLLSEIDQIADHVGVISRGRLVFQDSLAAMHQKSTRQLWLHTSDDRLAAEVLTAGAQTGALPETLLQSCALPKPVLRPAPLPECVSQPAALPKNRAQPNALPNRTWPGGTLPGGPLPTDGLLLPALNDPQAASLSLLLAQHGIGVIRMELRQKTLEDIFLDMTGKEAAL